MSDTDTPTFGRSVPRDEDLEVTGAPSLLDELRAEVKQDVVGEPITMPIPGRPGWAIRYRCDIENPTLTAWRKKNADKSPEGVDSLKLSCVILANQAECFVRYKPDEPVAEGIDALDEDGHAVNFTSQWLLIELGVGKAIEAVKKWYGLDGTIIAHAQEVLLGSGFGADAERLDPTQRR